MSKKLTLSNSETTILSGSKQVGFERTDFQWFQHYTLLYIKYVDVYKDLEDSYDQLAHPQKRRLLKEMLENTMIRLCEIKNELVRYNTHSEHIRSDFVHLDELLMDLKVNQKEMDFPIPRYFRDEGLTLNGERDALIDNLLEQFHDTKEPEEEVLVEKSVLDGNHEIAIRLIQKLERGRQGIERMKALKIEKIEEMKKKEELEMMTQRKEIAGTDSKREGAVIVVQKYFRGFQSREKVWNKREKEFLFLGMKRVRNPQVKEELAYCENKRNKLKLIQKENEEEFQLALEEEKLLIDQNEGPDIKQRMIDERRDWMMDYLKEHNFAELPKKITEFDERVIVREPMTAEEEDERKIAEDAKAKAAKAKKENKGKDGKKPKKTDQEEFLASRTQIGPSAAVLSLKSNIEAQTRLWGVKNETDNFIQRHDVAMVREEVRPTVESRIKKSVEDIMAVELDSLRIKRKIKKGKDVKLKPIKPPKRKNILEIKLLKVKGIRQWLEELVEVGIVKKLKPAALDDLIGDANLMGAQQERSYPTMPDPSSQQIRQLLVEYIAIPLGCQKAHDTLERVNNVLFYGPMGGGKSLMMRALASECNAMLFDLSPSNLEGKYEKAKAKQIAMAAALVAKEFTPSIIYIDEAEKLFPGGKKKARGLGAVLKKLFGEIKKKRDSYFDKPDRVVYIFSTNKPFECSAKEMKAFFDKKIYFPYPNYSSRQKIFKELIEMKGGSLDENFSLMTLAAITEGYTGGSFKFAIDKVLTPARLKSLSNHPLKLEEFIGALGSAYCMFDKEYSKTQEFTDEVMGLKELRDARNKNDEDDNDKKKSKKK